MWEQPECPLTDGETKKMRYIHNEMLLSVTKNEIMTFIYIYIYIYKIKHYSAITKNEIMPLYI